MSETAPNSAIFNERQFQERVALLKELRRTLAGLPPGNVLLASPMKKLIADLEDGVGAYLALKSGSVRKFETHAIEELPDILMQSRIAQGLKRADLGVLLGISENTVHRYERERFQTMSLRRLCNLTEALKLHLVGTWEIR